MCKYKENELGTVASVIAAVAALLALFAYGTQAYYMHWTMKASQGAMEAQYYAFIQNAADKIYNCPKAHEFYRSLKESTSTDKGMLTFNEIYSYFNILNAACSLFLTDKIGKENFFDFYGGHITEAARVLTHTAEEKRYRSITTLAEKIEDCNVSQFRRPNFLTWSLASLTVILFLSNLFFICCLICRKPGAGESRPTDDGDGETQTYLVKVAKR